MDLSPESKKLIGQLTPLLGAALAWPTAHKLTRADVVVWLKKAIPANEQNKFLLESLRASLLDDLHDSFLTPEERAIKRKSPSLLKKAQYVFLAIAGTLLALCEGFDGIASILGSFTAVPTMVVFVVGVCFAFLSVGIFCGFELLEISKKVGVSMGKTGQLLDVLLEQVQDIKTIRKIIDKRLAAKTITDAAERQELQDMTAMLIERYKSLDKARQDYLTKLDNPVLQLARFLTAGMTALIFFSGGFFAGQTLALTVAGLFMASVAATFWPIVVASSIVGLAALSVYWFIQRPGLEHLVSHWVGLDKDSIDAFADPKVVQHQKQKLQDLQDKLSHVNDLYAGLKMAPQPTVGLEGADPARPAELPIARPETPETMVDSHHMRRNRNLLFVSAVSSTSVAPSPPAPLPIIVGVGIALT